MKEVESDLVLGEAAFNSGDFNQARSLFLECLILNPNHSRTLSNLGVIACEEGNYTEAEAYLKKACLCDASNKMALLNWFDVLSLRSAQKECLSFLESYLELIPDDTEINAIAKELNLNSGFTKSPRPLRIAWRNRPDMKINLGGDCTVINEVTEWLNKQGQIAEIRLENTFDHSAYDIIHLNNISRSQDTLEHLSEAKKQGKITVLTSLYEDMDRYLIPSIQTDLLFQYLMLKKNYVPLEMIPKLRDMFTLNVNPLDNPINKQLGIGDKSKQAEILRGVDLILTSGKVESELIARKFVSTAPIQELHYGFNREFENATSDLFVSKYGLKDFALCIGRFEPRKNQYQLIEVFRTLPHIKMVFVGVFFDQAIEAQVKAYAPKNVHFFSRLPLAELASACAAAHMHILPSWYELPGLVSLEAAAAGAKVVTTDWGTARDYFGDLAYYVSPDDPVQMRKTILEAYNSKYDPRLKQHVVENFSWEKTAKKVNQFYRKLL